ncbi:ATP-binding cassette domain-containing protein [Patulibacter sp. NPDC049589]|uniref:ABC transporter permease subunit n=1 Tax=Patulibacter sp. NPDC049589 TaxID=3154731 RepID=UPI003441D6B0
MLLPYIISGLVTGAVYGLAAVGLVLTNKTSGVFNFAHGSLATVSAYLFYTLHIKHDVPWPVAAFVCVFVAPIPIALAIELVGRSIGRASLASQVAATVGIALIVQAIVLLIYGVEETRTIPVFLAKGQTTIGSTTVQYADIVTVAIAVGVTALLYAFFRISRSGVAMRGIVDDASLLDLAGTDPVRVRRLSWIIGVSLASLSGVLFASLLPLDPTLLTLLVVQAFGAAALGGFTSLPLTFAGGLGIGVLASLSTKWFTTGLLASVTPALPFIVLFVVLLVFPKRYLVERVRVLPRAKGAWTPPAPLSIGAGVVLLLVLVLVPSFAGIHLADWTTAVGTVIIFLSLGLLVRLSGQVSLSHVAFAAIGACALGHLVTEQHVPWFLALLCSGFIAVPIGALLAIPAMRLTGLYLALATFGFGVALNYMFYPQDFMFGSTGLGTDVPRPSGFTSDKSFYFLVLGFAVVATLFVVVLGRSRLGRLLRGMADSPTALTTSGTSVNVTRTLVFCLSAFMAAIGGALVGAGQETISNISYPPLLSLTYLVLVVVCLGREPWYAVMAAGLLIVVPSYLDGEATAYWLQLGFGVSAVAYAVLPGRAFETPAVVRDAIDRLFRRTPVVVPGTAAGPAAGDGEPAAAVGDRKSAEAAGDWTPAQAVGGSKPAGAAGGKALAKAATPGLAGAAADRVVPASLEVTGLRVTFGGNVAVDGFSMAAPTGRITGLIGPNGAGKTTTFNACSGLLRPTDGHVVFDGSEVTRRGPSARARRGLGRTFQRMELFDSLSVRENVAIGWEGSRAGPNPFSHLLSTPGQKRAMRVATDRALALCELDDVAGRPAGSLSTGQRRLVELARCLAGPFRVLLLDEPSSGLDHVETERFGRILQRVVAERGVGILLVEHDMSLVMEVCEQIYVLDFGKPLFEGPPSEVLDADVVRAAYLGEGDDAELAAAATDGAGA